MLKVINVTNARGDVYTFGPSLKFIEGPDFSGLSIDSDREFYFKFQIRRGKMSDAAMQVQKTRLYTVLNPTFNPMRLELLVDDGKTYYIDSNLITAPIMPPDWGNTNAVGVKVMLQFRSDRNSLLYEKDAQLSEISTFDRMLEFDVSEIIDNEFEFDEKTQSLFQNAFNSGHDYAPVKILFIATQRVIKPQLLNVNTYEHITLNMTLEPNDTVEVISTHKRVSVTLIRDNVRTKAFSRLTLDSSFLLLAPGDNIFSYNAESGEIFLEVLITHHNRWIGV